MCEHSMFHGDECTCSHGHSYGHPYLHHGSPFRGLVRIAILSLIKKKAMHGAEIHRLLKEKFGIEIPRSVVYILLRRMEHFGFVTSRWETEGGGPAKRVYVITDEGIEYLEAILETLKETKKIIDAILAENEEK